MNVILFGAGASFGSKSAVPYLPPLGSGLFDELQKQYPEAWGRIPISDRRHFVPNFEPGMKSLWQDGTYNPPVLMRCLADYFARFRSRTGNTYAKLLDYLSDRKILAGTHFSTLNYECILETAARDFGFREIQYFASEPTKDKTFSLWKIHGSCNFLPASISGGAANIAYSAQNVKWEGEIRIVDPFQVTPFVAVNAFYPAMAVFMEGKPVCSHPSAIGQLQDWWGAAIERAEKIGIVGVRPNEIDAHIWGPLAATSAKVVVIGDKIEFRKWAQDKRSGKNTCVVGELFDSALSKFVDELAT